MSLHAEAKCVTHVNKFTYKNTCVCVCACVCACVYACVYACVCVCMHVCVCSINTLLLAVY